MSRFGANDFHLARQQMVDRQLAGRDIKNKRVLEVMGKLPRHFFVEEAFASRAYGDHPLPIGEQQTISQPYIVAQMTQALDPSPTDHVLEIGTGSGYQAAVLAELCKRVYTVERIKPLQMRARTILEKLGYRNVLYKLDDGTLGWPEQSPFDGIIVTAGSPEVPEPLVEQLTPGGRLIVPVGRNRQSQTLMKIVKDESGKIERQDLGGCRFVDLIGKHGWSA